MPWEHDNWASLETLASQKKISELELQLRKWRLTTRFLQLPGKLAEVERKLTELYTTIPSHSSTKSDPIA
jgi:hypothetical protein